MKLTIYAKYFHMFHCINLTYFIRSISLCFKRELCAIKLFKLFKEAVSFISTTIKKI